jgi:hypothetical protein
MSGDWGRYAEPSKSVEIVYFHQKLGSQKCLTSLMSPEKLLAICSATQANAKVNNN